MGCSRSKNFNARQSEATHSQATKKSEATKKSKATKKSIEIVLTPDEIDALKSIWAPIMKTPADVGVAILEKFFMLYPHQKQRFWFMKSNALREKGMRTHGEKVVKKLDEAVKLITRGSRMRQSFQRVGYVHLQMGIEEEDMEQIGKAIVATVEDAFRNKLTPEEIGAFQKFIDMFNAEFALGQENRKAAAQW